MNLLLLLPVISPLLTAILSLLAGDRRPLQHRLSLIGMTAMSASAIGLLINVAQDGIQTAQMGNWPAPFGITFVADLFSAIMVLLTGLMGMAVTIYSLNSIDIARERFGYYALLNVLVMGVAGAFLTGDIFNLYVWFEVMLIASFVLLALGGGRAQTEGAIKYVTLNLLSSALFLIAVGILYGLAGTLNMAHLARQVRFLLPEYHGLVTTLGMLFLVAFGIKSAIFPLFFWLPASYHTPPAPVAAIFAGLLTKVGVYSLIGVFTLIFVTDVDYNQTVILIISGLTMVTGILGALVQNEFRRILSFNLVSHIGFITMGLALGTPLALAGAIFYIIHDVIVKTNLFLISGLVQRLTGSDKFSKTGGLYRRYPMLAWLFLIPALSLAGIPPLSGFWPKLMLLTAALDLKDYIIVAAALLTSLLTLMSMTKIWQEVFWKDRPDGNVETDLAQALSPNWLYSLLPVIGLSFMTVLIGLAAEPIFALASRAANQLLDVDLYITTVLGG